MRIKEYIAVQPITAYIFIGIEGISQGFTDKVKFSYSHDGIQGMTHTAKLRTDAGGREYFNSYNTTYYIDEFSRVDNLYEEWCNRVND